MKQIKKILLLFLVIFVASCASLETPEGDPVEVYISWDPKIEANMRWRENHDRNAIAKFVGKFTGKLLESKGINVEIIEPFASFPDGPATYALELSLTRYSAERSNTDYTVSYELKKEGRGVLRGSGDGEGRSGAKHWRIDAETISAEISDRVFEKIVNTHSIVVE